MRTGKKGSLTIFLALTMLGFLSFCLVLVEGTRVYYLRVKAEQAMELSGFSVLSEYQRELFETYGVFFLDLDYEQGQEYTAVLEQRAKKYLEENAVELTTVNVEARKFQRATDGGGAAFFAQAVKQMKFESGYQLLEELTGGIGGEGMETIDVGEILNDNENVAGQLLDSYTDAQGFPKFQISLPNISFPTIGVLTEAVFGDSREISKKSIDMSERIMERVLEEGTGRKVNPTLTDMQLFHAYLMKYFHYYGAENPQIPKEVLEYQLEYILSGQQSDQENLENMMWRIFLLRVGGDYLFYHQDAGKLAEAEAEAVALVGITGNAVLIQVVREIFLIAQAIADGIEETRSIFAGEKVPLYQNGLFSGLEFGYREYLFLFLNTMGETKKIYRSMDIAELEVRKKSGYEALRLDHCVDALELEWTYQFESLFEIHPFINSGIYENTISKQIFYEK